MLIETWKFAPMYLEIYKSENISVFKKIDNSRKSHQTSELPKE
ncbi:MAG: hypothetical protein ACI9R7_001109, partial [Lysobacterales bacterium]